MIVYGDSLPDRQEQLLVQAIEEGHTCLFPPVADIYHDSQE